jgi:glycogen synthase
MAFHEMLAPDYIFESSWEVCNKVGGIYTVLSTRVRTLLNLFKKDKIFFIGPFLHKKESNIEFIESETILDSWRKYANEQEGLKVRVGYWNIPGKPITILVDFLPFYEEKDIIYFQMWEKYHIDSTVAYGDYDDSCMFAYATSKVIESLYHFLQLQGKKVIAHLNEWMLGMAVLYIHKYLPTVATLFTTHATSIGRSICANNKPLYGQLSNYNGDQMASELNIKGKHTLEKLAAFYANCFTTVSEITGKECTQLLEKKPDIIIPNGFDSDFVPKGKMFETKKVKARSVLINVIQKLIGLSIPENAFLLATAGRYEYKNKGIDVFIETICRLKKTYFDRPIIAFVLVPACLQGARADLKERLENAVSSQFPLPRPFITHELVGPLCNDPICEYLYYLNFTNEDDSQVKIIFVPSYLNGEDGIFNMVYYDLLIGMDLTVFPSYYEPWGYTPLESIAFHIPTITTNLTGFGIWAKSKGAKSDTLDLGVAVVERTDDNYFETAEAIKNIIVKYITKYDSSQILNIQRTSCALSKKAFWSHFIKYYLQAYDVALRKL